MRRVCLIEIDNKNEMLITKILTIWLAIVLNELHKRYVMPWGD